MRTFFSLVSSLFLCGQLYAQSTVLVRNSTWQNFNVAVTQLGTTTVNQSHWTPQDSLVRSWIESTGQEVLTVSRSNTAIPEGDTVYYHVDLQGYTDTLTIKLRLVGTANGSDMHYSIAGNSFAEPWYADAGFHEVQTILAGKPVIIKFRPDNDDATMQRNIRFALHDLPVYELDESDFEDPNVLNVMYYNIQMISFGVSGMPQANERGSLLPAQISPYQDVVCFAEAFDDTPRENFLTPAMQAAGFPYKTEILNATGVIPVPTNGGVIIFSRWPIEMESEIEYEECGPASADCLAKKGMKYARINKLGKRYHVFGTHMDAGSGADDIYARRTQMAEIRDFISSLAIPQSEPVIFGGDFNTNPIDLDMDYQAFLDTMSPIVPHYLGFYESNFNDEFGGIIDHAWADSRHLIPTEITNNIITIRSLDPVLWELSEFSDHRCVLGRFSYPDFSKSISDTLICPGESLTLAVETTHSATYQWVKDGTPLNSETTASLTLNNATELQSGNYVCLVSYDVTYGHWGDSLTSLFYPNGAQTVTAELQFDFGTITVDEVQCQVGISENEIAQWQLYPNPSNGTVHLQLPTQPHNVELTIFSAQGKAVFATTINRKNMTFNLSHLSQGTYTATLTDPTNGTWHQSLVLF